MSTLSRLPVLVLALVLAIAQFGCGGKGVAPAADPGAAAAPATATTPAPGELAVDPAVRIGRLPNGLTYYVRKNARPEKRVALWLAVDAGAALEDDDQRGLAHFLEHMAFNGTRRFAKQEIVDYLERIGMRFGPDVNASTSFDETLYQLELPAEDDALARGLDILHEWASAIALDPAEVVKERGVVLEEWRLGRGAQGRLLDKLIPVVFAGSRYAERLPIGKKEILEGATAELLGRFYRDWYRPEHMAVFAVGDVDPAELERLVVARFGDLAATGEARPRPSLEVPSHDAAKVAVVSDPELPITAVAVATKLPTRPLRTEADWRAALLEQLFDAMLSDRLDERKEQPGSPMLGAGAGRAPIVRTVRGWFAFAAVKGEGTLGALEVLLAELERIRQHGFTPGELDRARKEILRALEQGVAEKDQRPSVELVEEMVRHFLTDEAMPGIEAELALARRILPAVTPADVAALAAPLLAERDRVVIVAGNPKMALPSEAEVAATAAAMRGKPQLAYVDGAPVDALLPEPPAPGAITKRGAIDELGLTEWTLSNGVRVLIKPTTFQNDRVSLVGLRPGGVSRAAKAEWFAARHAPEIALRGGFGTFSRIQLDRALAGTGVGAAPRIEELHDAIDGVAPPSHLETLFQLVHLQLTAPRRDADAFAAWQAEAIQQRRDAEADPGYGLEHKLRQAFHGGHPLRQETSVAAYEAIELDRALAAYRDHFGDARGFTFVIVGNVDLAALEPLVVRYLGGLPAGTKAPRWKDVGARHPRKPVRVEHRQGKEPKAQAVLIFHRPARWSREELFDLGAMADVLRIRLREILREDLGGVYGVSVDAELVRDPIGHAAVEIRFGCAPDKVDALLAAARAEIAALQKDGPAASYVDKVKAAKRRARETDLRENDFWLDALATSVRLGTDPRLILQYDALVERTTADRVKATAKRYLREPTVLGTLVPEAAP